MSKKILILISVVLAALTFTSCAPLEDEEDGVFVIKNQSEYDDVITDIWIKKDSESNYFKHEYSDLSIRQNDSFTINDLKSGKKYKFQVEVDVDNNGNNEHHTFEIGYNVFRKLEDGDTINVIFDGVGLYFE